MTIRGDRDVFDYLTILAAFVAIVASIIVPVLLRGCDQRAQQPDVEILAQYMGRLSPEHNFTTITSVVATLPSVELIESYMGGKPSIRNELTWSFDYHRFRILFNNRGKERISLRRFRLESPKAQCPDPQSHAYPSPFALAMADENLTKFSRPMITLEPKEIRVVNLISGFQVDFDTNTQVTIHSDSIKEFESLPESERTNGGVTTYISEIRNDRSKMRFATKSVLHSYFGRITYEAVTLSADDNSGRSFTTGPINMKLFEPVDAP